MTKFRKEHTDKLLALYYSGKLDEEAKEIVQGWLFSDDNRKAKDANILRLFEKIVREKRRPDDYTLRSLAVLHEELGFTDREIRSLVSPSRRISFRLMVSAAVAAAVILAGIFILPELFTTRVDRVEIAEVTVVSTPDSNRNVTLPDGSVVKLKGATTIAYADNFKENRKLRIDGEAYFIVARDEEHPFTVESSDVTVSVLGTEFNMKAFEADAYAEVVLTTGKIKVSSDAASVTLKPSERATIDKRRHTIDLDEIGEGELLRLRGINLILDDVSLDDAFRLIGEYYQIKMKVSTTLPDINGILVKLDDDATLKDVLFLLQAMNPVFDYQIDENIVTITKRK